MLHSKQILLQSSSIFLAKIGLVCKLPSALLDVAHHLSLLSYCEVRCFNVFRGQSCMIRSDTCHTFPLSLRRCQQQHVNPAIGHFLLQHPLNLESTGSSFSTCSLQIYKKVRLSALFWNLAGIFQHDLICVSLRNSLKFGA